MARHIGAVVQFVATLAALVVTLLWCVLAVALYPWLVPADLVFVTVLQLTLIMEVALVHRVNLKSDRARDEVFEVLAYSNGADTVNLAGRAGPKVLARVAEKVLTKRGLAQLGRVVPILASPVVAYLNNRDLQRAGEAAVRFYGTIRQLPRRRPVPAV